jgi:carboxymethylenebutenolidase
MNLFQRYLVEEFTEDYQDGFLDREEALRLITSLCGSEQKAESLLSPLNPTSKRSTGEVNMNMPGRPRRLPSSPEDPDASIPAFESKAAAQSRPPIQADEIQFPGENTPLLGYLAHPSKEGRYPIVLVCHENRGLTEHIKDVTRRFANAGYAAFAVDLLSRHGGTKALDYSEIPSILGNIDPDQFVKDFISAWHYIRQQPFTLGEQVGMTGFCFGGGVTWRVATRMPELRAAVPFYGPHPPVEDVANIRAAVLAIYAERDQRINQGIPAVEEKMQALHKPYAGVIYPDAEHAFFNDTGPRYNPGAAQDAWRRTLSWFEKNLEREDAGI